MEIFNRTLVSFDVPVIGAHCKTVVAMFFNASGRRVKFFGVRDAHSLSFIPLFGGREFPATREENTALRSVGDEWYCCHLYERCVKQLEDEEAERKRIEKVVLQMKKDGKI